MKSVKIFVVVLIGLFLLGTILVSGQTLDTSGIEDIEEQVEDLKEFTEKDRWEYLGEQWQESFLKNKNIARFDNFLKKINPVFVVLFGQDYSLSLILFGVFVSWLFFFVSFGQIMSTFSTFSKWASWSIGFILSLIMSHLKMHNFFAEFMFKVIFYRGGIWDWISAFMAFVGIVLVLSYMGKIMRGLRKGMEWAKLKYQVKVQGRRIEAIEKPLGDVGRAIG